MIRSFADKEAEKPFDRRISRKLPPDIQRIARRKLEILHAAGNIQDLRYPPSNRFGKLKGERKLQHSIRIDEQWRICFRWHAGDAFEVEIVDYHSESL
ncbi:MAG: type II toxin-antitoxin system RelE/ParE family toxin [Pyrinomonadaceae bacterium]